MRSCSIIIPVYNNWSFTEQCLDSIILLSHWKDEPAEIIVIDDDSEDGTEEKIQTYTAQYSFVRYFKNRENLGYAGSCNRGAGLAEGAHLIFLNNDTRVTEGWLEQLVNTIQKDRNIWIVGAKCLYPDQTVQHAGVAFPDFYKNYLPHLYKDAPGFFPLVNYEKDYQCVTGACMIIRKEGFEELSGFDESYRNGFEDVDLCLKVIEKGKRIVYQPGCTIIHYESKSDGRFDHAKHNKQILLEHWETKIIPDEAEHFRDDLQHCLEEGSLRLKEDFLENSARKLRFEGQVSGIKNGFIQMQPSQGPNSVFIPEQGAEHGEYMLIAGEFTVESNGTIKLKFLTSGETIYSEQQCFAKRAASGRNIFYFTLNPAFLHGELVLEFVNFKEPLEIHKLQVFTFNDEKDSKDIPVAVLFKIQPDEEQVEKIVSSLNSDDRGRIRAQMLNAPSSAQQHPGTLPGAYNEMLAGSHFKYAVSFNDYRDISMEQIKHIVALMETDPGIGVVFHGQAGFLPIHSNFISDVRKNQQISLRGTRDIPLAFRMASWEDAGRFDPHFAYYYNLDLCLSVIETGNWKEFVIEGPGLLSYEPESVYPPELKAGLEHFRKIFFEKHGFYLANLLSSMVKPSYNATSAQADKSRQVINPSLKNNPKRNPHDTLLGSVKVHLKHYLSHKLKWF